MSSRTKINELTAEIYHLREERTELSNYLDRARTDRDNNAIRANLLEAELAKYQPPKPAGVREYEKLVRNALYDSTSLYPKPSRYYDYKPAKPTYAELEVELARAKADRDKWYGEAARRTNFSAAGYVTNETYVRETATMQRIIDSLNASLNKYSSEEVERRRKLAQAEAQVKELDNRLRKSIDDYNALADRKAEERRVTACSIAMQETLDLSKLRPLVERAADIERYLAGKPARKAKANGKSGK